MREKSMIKEVVQRENAPRWYTRFHVSDYVVLLHLPFSSLVVDFALIGAAMAQTIYLDRLIPALIGVFLAHQGSHYLDEVRGYHWNTRIKNGTLYHLGLTFLIAAGSIGVYLSFTVNFLLAAFIIPMVFIPMSYSLELWNDRFHSPLWFGVSCALVCVGSFFLQALTLSLFSVLMSIAVGIQGIYIIILYEATKNSATRVLAWNVLKGIVVLWNLIALAMLTARFL